MNEEHDPLFEKLKSHAVAPEQFSQPPPELRDAIFAQTRHTLLMRRVRRRAGYAAAMAAVYIAGFATHLAFTPRNQAPEVTVASAPIVETTAPPTTTPTDEALTEAELLNAEQIALRLAKLDNSGQAELLREAADAYLREHDYATALTYYRQHLNRIEPDQRARADADDSWLLLSLKQDQLQEISYANSTGR
jgi:hypothetical protein